MSRHGKKPRVEREETNDRLRVERERTDAALGERQATLDRSADDVISEARRVADAVLDVARDQADDASEPTATALEAARAHADELLRAERATADDRVRRARAASVRALSKLLPLERDETDRTLLTERARADADIANRDDFLGIVSHDLRNLLGAVILSGSAIETLAAEGATGSDIHKEVARIQRYVARMNRLIGDLVDVASIDAGRLQIARAPGDLAASIAEVVDTFEPAARAKGLALRAEPIEGALAAEFDADRIFQVLANIVTNAIKFTPAGGTIVVRADRDGDAPRIAVTDTGPGIPASMHEAVFERFWQVGEDDRRGVGLGLYIARSLVLAHGGRIWVEHAPGQGTRFTFTIPVTPPSAG